MPNAKSKSERILDKAIDFGKQLFAAVLRSRTGALSELARLLRFQRGTKGFEREYSRLLPLITEIKEAFESAVLASFPDEGLRLGIIDDSAVKKKGKQFPKERILHDHSTGGFFPGMNVLTSGGYQNGKFAAVSSQIVGKEQSKLELAQQEVGILFDKYFVDVVLFDSWYCTSPLIGHIADMGKLFISRARCNSKVEFYDEEARLDALFRALPHREYEQICIQGKSYWIKDCVFDLKTQGMLRVIVSKEGQHDEPVFLVTNATNFSAQFVVKLYLRRFAIEVFFKDVKQHLNFETFLCRKETKWDLHLLLTNVLHWAMQKRHSISKIVRSIRENIHDCLLFINQNCLLNKFFDELTERCRT